MTDGTLRRGLSALLATRRRKLIASGAIAVLVIGAGSGVALATTRTDDGRYRTATAQKADVTETLALTGQVSSAASADAAFQVSGTVGSVLVKLGDRVAAGQKLATLDETALKNAVTSSEDALAKAQQQLEDDLDAQSSGSSSTSSTSSASNASSSQASSGASSVSAPASSGTSSTDKGTQGSSSSDSATQGGSSATPATGSSDAPSQQDSAEIVAGKKKVASAQQTLLARYTAAADAQKASAQATTDAQKMCAPFLDATIAADGTVDTDNDTDAAADDAEADITPTPSATDDTGDDDTADTTTDDSANDDSDALADAQALLQDCQTSISDTLDKQKTTAAAQDSLQDAAHALDDAVAALTKAWEANTTTSAGQSPSPSTAPNGNDNTQKPSTGESGSSGATGTSAKASTSPSTPSASSESSAAASGTGTLTSSSSRAASSGGATGGGPSSTASKTVTAEQILADRAQIDLAEAEVSVAEQNVEFATLTSPMTGTVVSVALATGDDVSAASTSAVITVQGDGGYVVTSTVALSKITKVAAGQAASITLPAFGTTYTGTVASIGVQNVSETSSPSYSVTVAIDAGDDDVRIGATARAAVTVSTADDVLTVPSSAVTVSGSQASVVLLKDGQPVKTDVGVGATGAERIEITKGLNEGDVVVLADLTEQIASESDSNSSTGLSGLGRNSRSGFSGTGFSGSGFSGGGFSGGNQGGPPTR